MKSQSVTALAKYLHLRLPIFVIFSKAKAGFSSIFFLAPFSVGKLNL